MIFALCSLQEWVHSGTAVVPGTWENGSCFASFPSEFGQANKKNLYWKVPLKHGVWNESCLGVTSLESIRWLLSAQSTSAGPSTLTSIHERSRVTKVLWRKKGSMWDGTTRSTKYSFPLHVRYPSGDSDGVSDTGYPPFVLNGICCLFQDLVSSIWRYSATIISLSRKWVCPDSGCLSKVTSCRKGKSNSVPLFLAQKFSQWTTALTCILTRLKYIRPGD